VSGQFPQTRIALQEAGRSIVSRPGQTILLVLSVATAVALAISIIAAGRGVEEKVSALLDIPLLPPVIDLASIHQILDQTRSLLKGLSYAFTAALVGTVTWVSIGRRRREIGIKRQYGVGPSVVLLELWAEATVLCIIGGLLGVGLGYLLCSQIQRLIPDLPMHPTQGDVVVVFPVVTLIGFTATAVVASYFAVWPSSEPEL
jgi:predicted lysophospholipase L1 biosynthesis ABC-type transport system permease subunit